MSLTLSVFAGVGAQIFDNNGVPLAGGKIYTYAAGTTTPLVTYTTIAGNVARTNPIILDSAGRIPAGGEIWVTAGLGYKFVVTTSTDVLIATYDNVPSSAALIIANDADSIQYEQGYTVTAGAFTVGKTYRILTLGNTDFTLIGAPSNTIGVYFVATGVGTGTGTAQLSQTVQNKLQESVNAVNDFGADNTGATNATTALLNFFNFCISSGKPGHIPAGNYLVTAGVLVFDNNFVDTAWPEITTDGYDRVVFLRADATNAPFITLSNGTATSNAGNFWNGGSLGGISFSQNGKATASGQHCLSLRGIWGIKFGWMRANNQGGSLIYLPQFLWAGSSPDPYSVSFCSFEAIEYNFSLRYAIENLNGVGFNGCYIANLRVIESQLGGWYGFGTVNICDVVSMGTVKGWAFDDGTSVSNLGGTPSRITINLAELDDVRYGFRLNSINSTSLGRVRFVHRYNFSVLNPGEGYWPRIAVSIAGGALPNVRAITGEFFHRLEAGGALGNLGTFFDFNSNGNSSDYDFDNIVADNGSLGFTPSMLATNVSGNSAGVVRYLGVPVMDVRIRVGAMVRSDATATVISGSYGLAASKVSFPQVMYDRNSYYSSADSWFVIPFSGLYRVSARICLTLPVGTRVRLGFVFDIAGAASLVLNSTNYQVNAGPQHYFIDGLILVNKDVRVYLVADQNTGSPVNLSIPISNTADANWTIESW